MKKNPRLVCIALAVAAMTVALIEMAGAEPGITVMWDMPTNHVDGTPLTDLAGAKVYYGTSSSNYSAVVVVPGGAPGETITYRLTMAAHGLLPGVTYYLNGTAYNTSGLESDFCNEVAKSFQIETVPRIKITETESGEVWGRVYEVVDGVFRQRWEKVK
jgi:hypothetical protein